MRTAAATESGQWLQVKMTQRILAEEKSAAEWSLPSMPGSLKSGMGAPISRTLGISWDHVVVVMSAARPRVRKVFMVFVGRDTTGLRGIVQADAAG